MSRPSPRNNNHLFKLKQQTLPHTTPEPTVTVCLPTGKSSPTLLTAIGSILWQDQPVRIIVIDTCGSDEEHTQLANDLQPFHDIDLYRIKKQNWKHLSQPVAAAIDLTVSQTETPWLFLTHDDVFLKRKNVISELIDISNETEADFVGYEMSPRSHLTQQWRGMISHTCTIAFTPAIRELRARWSLIEALRMPECDTKGEGWPDTETAFGLTLRRNSIQAHFVGHETNQTHFEDERIVHRRSLTSHRLLWPALAKTDEAWVQDEIRKQEQRQNVDINIQQADSIQADTLDLLPAAPTAAASL